MQDEQWNIMGASVVGVSHIKHGYACEDSHAFKRLANGSIILAVADGAGSAQFSSEGSAFAVKTAIDALEHMLLQKEVAVEQDEWKKNLEQVIIEVRTKLGVLPAQRCKENSPPDQGANSKSKDSAKKLFSIFRKTLKKIKSIPEKGSSQEASPKSATLSELYPLHDFATTLLIAAITSQWILAAQIGDGAIVIQEKGEGLKLLIQPGHGEYLNETNFITDSNFLQYIQYVVIPYQETIDGIVLLTDGLENLALDFVTKTPYQPFFVPLFQFVRSKEATKEEFTSFLSSERICSRTDDDKTLLLAVRA